MVTVLRNLICLCFLFSTTLAAAAVTQDEGHIHTVRFDGKLVFTLQEGMPNAIADRACRIEAFASDRHADVYTELILFAKQHNLLVRVTSQRCLSTNDNGVNAFHRFDALKILE